LHYSVEMRQPSGRFGVENMYPYLMNVWKSAKKVNSVAVARPHLVGVVGEEITLFGGNSFVTRGANVYFKWRVGDVIFYGRDISTKFSKPGQYQVNLEIFDQKSGKLLSRDTSTVLIYNRDRKPIPFLITAVSPAEKVKAGKALSIWVRAVDFIGCIHVDFGDGSPLQERCIENDNALVLTHQYNHSGQFQIKIVDPKGLFPAPFVFYVERDATE